MVTRTYTRIFELISYEQTLLQSVFYKVIYLITCVAVFERVRSNGSSNFIIIEIPLHIPHFV